MPQPQTLSTRQLDAYKARIDNAGSLAQQKAAAIAVYQELYNQGYNYAGWALGVASGSTLTGVAAVNFLIDTALLGLDSETCRQLTPMQLDKIRVEMAEATLKQMIEQAERTNSVLHDDLSFQRVSDAHKTVFLNNGLHHANHQPGHTGGDGQELHSCRCLERCIADPGRTKQRGHTGGDGMDGVLASAQLVTFMGQQASTSNDPAIRQAALAWMDVVPGTGNWASLARSAELVLQLFDGGVAGKKLSDTDAAVIAQVVGKVQGQSTNSGGSVLSTPIDAPTRNSASYITDTSASDHVVVVRAGGTVWDAYVSQKNVAGGLSDWSEFKAAVAASNPQITDLNNLAAGTTLYLPQRMADGSTTYHYGSGASINSNAVTGEYHMVLANTDGGGGQTVYSRTVDAEAGYVVKQVQTNAAGAVVYDYLGFQESLSGDLRPISSSWETPAEVVQTSWGSDGSYTTQTTNLATQVETVKSFTGAGVLNGASQTQDAPRNVATTDALSGMFLSWREQLGQLDDAVAAVSEKRLPSEYIVAKQTFGYVRQTRPPGRTIGSPPMLFLSCPPSPTSICRLGLLAGPGEHRMVLPRTDGGGHRAVAAAGPMTSAIAVYQELYDMGYAYAGRCSW